jgi:hypothetical protein
MTRSDAAGFKHRERSDAEGMARGGAVGGPVVGAEPSEVGEPPPVGDHRHGHTGGRVAGLQVTVCPFQTDLAGVLAGGGVAVAAERELQGCSTVTARSLTGGWSRSGLCRVIQWVPGGQAVG